MSMVKPELGLFQVQVESRPVDAAELDQPVVSLPLIGVDRGLTRHKPFDYRHQRGCGTVLHHLGVDFIPPFLHPEDDGLPGCAAPPFPAHPPRPEVGLVYLYLALPEA